MSDDSERIDNTTWRYRETERQYTRAMPVWINESWYVENRQIWRDHYLHVSANDRKLLAYTADADKGRRDIQTPIKPGKYLAKYFNEILSAKQIKYYATWQTTGVKESAYTDVKAYPLAFARTASEIVDVYMRGPNSCMDGRNFRNASTHPCQVYGAGDLAVAYLTDTATGKPRARALVWPSKKIIGRVYPTSYVYREDGFDSESDSSLCAEALTARLFADGYRSDQRNGFDGARLSKCKARNDNWLMPYLDHDYGVDNDGSNWIMAINAPEYPCQSTDGTLEERDNDPEYDWHCDNCNDAQGDCDDQYSVYTAWRRNRPAGQQAWCEHCRDNNAFWCHGSEEYFSDDDMYDQEVEDLGRCVQEWVDDNCTKSDYSEEYYVTDDTEFVTMANDETWTDDEFEQYGFTCEITNKRYNNYEQHPDHPTIHADCDDDDIAAWLLSDKATTGTIDDTRQITLDDITAWTTLGIAA